MRRWAGRPRLASGGEFDRQRLAEDRLVAEVKNLVLATEQTVPNSLQDALAVISNEQFPLPEWSFPTENHWKTSEEKDLLEKIKDIYRNRLASWRRMRFRAGAYRAMAKTKPNQFILLIWTKYLTGGRSLDELENPAGRDYLELKQIVFQYSLTMDFYLLKMPPYLIREVLEFPDQFPRYPPNIDMAALAKVPGKERIENIINNILKSEELKAYRHRAYIETANRQRDFIVNNSIAELRRILVDHMVDHMRDENDEQGHSRRKALTGKALTEFLELLPQESELISVVNNTRAVPAKEYLEQLDQFVKYRLEFSESERRRVNHILAKQGLLNCPDLDQVASENQIAEILLDIESDRTILSPVVMTSFVKSRVAREQLDPEINAAHWGLERIKKWHAAGAKVSKRFFYDSTNLLPYPTEERPVADIIRFGKELSPLHWKSKFIKAFANQYRATPDKWKPTFFSELMIKTTNRDYIEILEKAARSVRK
jgi:hypothetical protein